MVKGFVGVDALEPIFRIVSISRIFLHDRDLERSVGRRLLRASCGYRIECDKLTGSIERAEHLLGLVDLYF